MRFRRHLQKGKNFNKWELKMDNETIYFPLDSDILLHNCTLKNKISIAKKIYDGENKRVCAWIDCTGFDYNYSKPLYSTFKHIIELFYNPRVYPFWTDLYSTASEPVSILDDERFEYIYIQGKRIFGIKDATIYTNDN